MFTSQSSRFAVLARFHLRILTAFLSMAAFCSADGANIFRSSGSILKPRIWHSSTVLSDGKVLIAGGGEPGSTAEIYDPASKTSSPTGSLHHARYGHTAILLPNNKVFVTGGSFSDRSEVFDPVSGTWSVTRIFGQLRLDHSATLLPNGKVLVAGGRHGNSLKSAELYDPQSDTWTPTGSMNHARRMHSATLLANGKVLVVGGGSHPANRSSEIYDPITGEWTLSGQTVFLRNIQASGLSGGHTATLLKNGKVLVAGGDQQEIGETAEIFDPSTGLWTSTARPNLQHYMHTAILLPDQTVLFAGGYDQYYKPTTYTEIFHPDTGTWTHGDPLISARSRHTSCALADGSILVVGGSSGFGDGKVMATETYSAVEGAWTPAAEMTSEREGPTLSLLKDGRLLVAGGRNHLTPGADLLSSCEILNPVENSWEIAEPMAEARSGHVAIPLPDGRVFVVGGGSALAEIYNPSLGKWSSNGNYPAGNTSMTATLLKSGRILVTGGRSGTASVSDSKLFDPARNSWAATGSMLSRRESHTATLLADGRVLVAGGFTDTLTNAEPEGCELYDPVGGTWSRTAPLSKNRASHSARLLPDGKVLVLGGMDKQRNQLADSEIYDPSTGSWSATQPMIRARSSHSTVSLADGRVLATGGADGTASDGQEGTVSAEIYDWKSGVWTPVPPLNVPRCIHAASLTSDGRVFIAGGLQRRFYNEPGYYTPGFVSSTEVFDPEIPFIRVEQPASNSLPADSILDFGNWPGLVASTLELNIRNVGTADLTGLNAVIEGTDANSFKIAAPLSGGPVVPGSQVALTISFTPDAPGTRNAVLRLSSDTYPFPILLRGSSYLPIPELAVFHPADTELLDGKFKKSFGTVKVGKSGAAWKFTMKNTGTDHLTNLAIFKEGKHKADFMIESSVKTTLAPGTSTSFKVTFRPATPGTRKASLRIRSNDADENPFEINLSGMGARP